MSDQEGMRERVEAAAAAARYGSARGYAEPARTAAPSPSFLLIADPQASADPEFLDDLVAANRLKTYLVGHGVEVPEEVLRGLGDLLTLFAEDIGRQNGEAVRSAGSVARSAGEPVAAEPPPAPLVAPAGRA
jgi:hypothetical protein